MAEEFQECGGDYLVQTRTDKTVQEVHDMYEWVDDNHIIVSHCGSGRYWVRGLDNATLLKMIWG